MSDISVHYLRSGDRISFPDFKPEFAPWKTVMELNEFHEVASTSSHIFQGGRSGTVAEWALLSSRLFDS